METRNVIVDTSIGLPGLLTILFIILKVFGKISWSWWLVFAPIWGPTALVICVMVIVVVGCLIAAVIANLMEKL